MSRKIEFGRSLAVDTIVYIPEKRFSVHFLIDVPTKNIVESVEPTAEPRDPEFPRVRPQDKKKIRTI